MSFGKLIRPLLAGLGSSLMVFALFMPQELRWYNIAVGAVMLLAAAMWREDS